MRKKEKQHYEIKHKIRKSLNENLRSFTPRVEIENITIWTIDYVEFINETQPDIEKCLKNSCIGMGSYIWI